MSVARRKHEEALFEKSSKAELNAERALDELARMRDEQRARADERRREGDEGGALARSIVDNAKAEVMHEVRKAAAEVERVRHEVDELVARKSDKREVADVKAKLLAALEPKVDLGEV